MLGFLCLCMVLVLIGSWLFAPTFLLRLTTHETTSHMVTNALQTVDSSFSGFKFQSLSTFNLFVLIKKICISFNFERWMPPIRVAAATMLVLRLRNQIVWLYNPNTFNWKHSVFCWKTCVAGTPSGHFTLKMETIYRFEFGCHECLN